jgi:hypothetical protein
VRPAEAGGEAQVVVGPQLHHAFGRPAGVNLELADANRAAAIAGLHGVPPSGWWLWPEE